MSPNLFALFKRNFLLKKGAQVTTDLNKWNTFNVPDNLATQISETFVETIEQKNKDGAKYKKKKGGSTSLHGSGNRYKLNEVNEYNNSKNIQDSFRRKKSNIPTTNVSVTNSIVLTAHNTESYKKTEVKSKCKCPPRTGSKQVQVNLTIEDYCRKIEGISLDGDCNIIDENYRNRIEIDKEPIESYEYNNEKNKCKTAHQQTGDFESSFMPPKKIKACPRTESHNEISEDCNCASELKYKTKRIHTEPKECIMDSNIKGDYKIDYQEPCPTGGFHKDKERVPNQFCDEKNYKARVEMPDQDNKTDETKCSCIKTRELIEKTKSALRYDIKKDLQCPCAIHKKQEYTPEFEQLFQPTGSGFNCESFDRNLNLEKQNSAKLKKLKSDIKKLLEELKKTQSRKNCCCNKKQKSCAELQKLKREQQKLLKKQNKSKSKIICPCNWTEQTSDCPCSGKHKPKKSKRNKKDKNTKCQGISNHDAREYTNSFLNTDPNCDIEPYQPADHPGYCSRDLMPKSQDCNKNPEEISNISVSNIDLCCEKSHKCDESYKCDEPNADVNFEEETEQHIETYASRNKLDEFHEYSINSQENTDDFYKNKSPHITHQNTDCGIENEIDRYIRACKQNDEINKAQYCSNDVEGNCKSYPCPRATLSCKSSASYYGVQTSSTDLGSMAFSKSCFSPIPQPNRSSNSTNYDNKTLTCEDDDSYLDTINKLITRGPGLLKNAMKCIRPRGIAENSRSEDLTGNNVKWYEELKNKQEHELVSCFKRKPTTGNEDNSLKKNKKDVSAGLKLKKVGQIIPFMKGLKLSLKHLSKPFI